MFKERSKVKINVEKLLKKKNNLSKKYIDFITSNKDTVFNYKFIRWHYGIYCEEIKKDIDFLRNKGLVKIIGNKYEIEKDGQNLLKKAESLNNNISKIKEAIENIEDRKYHEMKLKDLLKRVCEEYQIETDYNMGDVVLPIFSNDEIEEMI